MHGLRCYGNITRTRNVSEYMLVLALCLVTFVDHVKERSSNRLTNFHGAGLSQTKSRAFRPTGSAYGQTASKVDNWSKYLAKGRIVAAHGVSRIVYNWPLLPPSKLTLPTGIDLDPHVIRDSLGPSQYTTETASLSVQPFLQDVHDPTDRRR